ncbi:MAG: DUF3343 domain-containing protein [Eubacteriales bacterium]|nr:DUF3343 domain-containing protein [Eubacteriales bacterium]
MRQKSLKLIISFSTTNDALFCDSLCMNNSIKGRLIPVPREISAGCGHAYMTEPENKEEILKLFEDNEVMYEEMRIMLY